MGKKSRKKPNLVQLGKQLHKQAVRSNKKRKRIAQHEKEQQLKKRKERVDAAISSYTPDLKYLLIGEGNFSFAVALAKMFGTAANIFATAFDSEEMLFEKYEDAHQNVSFLLDHSARVLLAVDCQKLSDYNELDGQTFDRIIFNFPHTGSGTKDMQRNVLEQQQMLLAFFRSATPFLTESGEIHVTVKQGEPYDSWNVHGLGVAEKKLKLKTITEFLPHLYPEYSHRRTIGFRADVSSDANEEIMKHGARTFVFWGIDSKSSKHMKSGKDDDETKADGSEEESKEDGSGDDEEDSEGDQDDDDNDEHDENDEDEDEDEDEEQEDEDEKEADEEEEESDEEDASESKQPQSKPGRPKGSQQSKPAQAPAPKALPPPVAKTQSKGGSGSSAKKRK